MIVGEEIILKYLNNDCKKSERDAIKSWIKEDTSNAIEMQRLQKIWSELDGLNSFVMPSMDDEWAQMNALISTQGGINGLTEPEKNNTSASRPLSDTSVSTGESAELTTRSITSDHKPVATAAASLPQQPTPRKEAIAVNTVNKATRTAKSDHLSHQKKSDIPTIDKIIYGIAALLALGILIWGIMALFKSKDHYLEMESTDKIENIALYDGSKVTLHPFSKLVYPRGNKKAQRRMSLTGSAIFDIMADAEPFIIDYGEVSVKTLGTAFEVLGYEGYTTAECSNGKIRFYQTANEANGVQVNEGEIFKYEGGIFENITIQEEEEAPIVSTGTDVRLDDLLDWLMEESKWKVISTPSMPFDRDYVVNVDLDRKYHQVLAELADEIDIIYESASCDGCFVIKKMKAL